MKSGYIPWVMTVQLDSDTFVELTGPNACLFCATGKAYDGPIAGLPESVFMKLLELGAIKPC